MTECSSGRRTPETAPKRIKLATLAFLCGTSICSMAGTARAEEWEPFPKTRFLNDFGGVGLIQTPTAQAAADGQLSIGASRTYPYERYFVTVQATPWLEATLRYSSVDNRLYSNVPEFSGDQSYKDRGLDMKLRLFDEGRIRPALAVGARDFLGTGLFSSEYIVASKEFGPVDASFGIGWGNMGSRGHISNPFRLFSSKFRERGGPTALGGTLSNAYFRGERVAFFGGLSYVTPIPGLTAKVEYDPNDYQSEALGNQFRVSSPINVGLDYRLRSWLHVGAAFERGNRLGLRLVFTTNVNKTQRLPKIDPPAPPVAAVISGPVATPAGAEPLQPATVVAQPQTDAVTATAVAPAVPVGAALPATGTVPHLTPVAEAPELVDGVDTEKLKTALWLQGAGLYSADFNGSLATLFVAQSRFRNMATGLGRVSRAAFSALPPSYTAVKVVFVESGVETMAATVYRNELANALTPGHGSTDQLFVRTEFAPAPLTLGAAEYQPETRPGFYYGIRPGLRTTLGRPEQFLLYQFWIRFNASLEIGRGLSATGSFGLNVSDNFDKMRITSDSVLPHVRSDIKEYLSEGRTAITHLQADYSFNIAPSLYGHVYGGLLEEMFGGVGGEVLYRPFDANWAVGADVNWVKQRDYDQYFDFRDYDVVTGHVTGFYHFETLELDATVKAGRFLAKDWGATFQLARTFKSGITVGAFATFTDVPASDFGEGRFDKGLFLTIPLDIFYIRNVRNSIGILWRPLIRDGGQALLIRRPLLGTTGSATMYNMARDWRDILD